MGKIAIIQQWQGREIYKAEIEPGAKFYPVLDEDMNIILSEEEIAKADPKVFPWITELELKEKHEIKKELTKEEWLEFDKQEYEKRIIDIEKKLDDISKGDTKDNIGK